MKKFLKKYYRLFLFTFVVAFIICSILLTFGNGAHKNNNISYSEEGYYTLPIQDSAEQSVCDLPAEGEVLAAKETAAPSEPAPQETEPEKEQSFIFPVGGEVLGAFRPEKLEYSKEMGDWRAHLATDFAALEDESVCAAEDGIVERVYTDPAYGKTLVLGHENEIKSIYAPLKDEALLQIGTVVSKGDIIGKVKTGCAAEQYDVPHLHFAMTEKGKYVNPLDLLK